jgi:2-iminobutanoate/2-iminopropanoate deaminase
MEDVWAVDEVYKQYFKQPYPARACYQAGKVPCDGQIEIEAIAVLGHITDV